MSAVENGWELNKARTKIVIIMHDVICKLHWSSNCVNSVILFSKLLVISVLTGTVMLLSNLRVYCVYTSILSTVTVWTITLFCYR